MTQCFSAPPAAAIVTATVSPSRSTVPQNLVIWLYTRGILLPRYDVQPGTHPPPGSAEAQYCELDVVPGDLNRLR